MTGRHSDEYPDRPAGQRSTDSEDIAHLPQSDRGVIQDGPGTSMTADQQGLLDEQGNYTGETTPDDEEQ
ncbi:hypothetical protein DEDE109153_07950 [Deinococcus deserti]|uniref:Uncharacterized protein n=1 Tax=Deinococcus deserti (strain DSM 17065 / CIP 109153 / LMG 22923 / VCD115) TaxID=546414 RepID=C1CW91_DEIDV|nr:hypothetical protein [Deinococcus deserti]ACO46458.1 hypothetical protein Deide_15020 [Deinococcus deserti VCD115]